jgi:predicted NUDIX family phosphoesterase
MSAEEHVLVVPTDLFHQLGYFQGFSDHVDHYLPTLLDSANTQYRPRSLMEQDPGFKQLIPYVIFRHCSADGEHAYFHYTRGHGQGEQRLHAKLSVGVGGHISVEDTQSGAPYSTGMQRELDEEVEFAAPVEAPPRDIGSAQRATTAAAALASHLSPLGRIIGLINDDSNDVGRVHLGVVHLVDLSQPWVRAREKDLVDARFSSPSELQLLLGQFETWSQIALQHLLVNTGRKTISDQTG